MKMGEEAGIGGSSLFGSKFKKLTKHVTEGCNVRGTFEVKLLYN